METTLVSTDFSDSSNQLIQYATNLSVHFNTSITIFHAYQIPIAYSDLPVATLSLEELRKRADEKMEEIKIQIQNNNKTVEVKTILCLGEPATELLKICREINPWILILGTGNSNKLERAFLGSTTMHAINHWNKPILITPNNAVFKKIQRIGFACDFMKVEKTTPTEIIKKFTKSFDAEFHICHVETGAEKEVMILQKELLQGLLVNISLKFHELINSDVQEGIHQFCIDNQIDLLITVPKKHQLIDRLFKRNNMKEIIFHSEIPILSIHE